MSVMTRSAGIYALRDPQSGKVMYIGQSVDIEFRFRQHCDCNHFDGNVKKTHWLNALKRNREEPVLEVLELISDISALDCAEKALIREYKSRGEAELNMTVGGNHRGKSILSNGHPDDWYLFAVKQREAKRLLIEMAQMAGEICDSRSVDFWLKLQEKIQSEIYRMEDKIRAVFPEWDDVYAMLIQEEQRVDREG